MLLQNSWTVGRDVKNLIVLTHWPCNLMHSFISAHTIPGRPCTNYPTTTRTRHILGKSQGLKVAQAVTNAVMQRMMHRACAIKVE